MLCPHPARAWLLPELLTGRVLAVLADAVKLKKFVESLSSNVRVGLIN